jgi:uncharacterized protein
VAQAVECLLCKHEALSSNSGLTKKNALDWVTYKEQKFIAHDSEGWEVQDQSTNACSQCLVKAYSSFMVPSLPSHVEEMEGAATL